jgi:hypothetical protein
MTIEKELSDKEAHKLFWEDKHEKCKKCSNKCKQSSKVIQIICPKFNGVSE